MTIKTFWTILVKIMGLWFIFMSLATIVQFLSLVSFTSLNSNSMGNEKIFLAYGIVFLAASIFILIICLLVFKTCWVIEKLRLTTGFEEERLELTTEWSTIMIIATIVIGGVIFIDSLPLFFKQCLTFFQQGKPFRNSPEAVWIFYYLVRTILGYLLMTNSRFFVNFIGRENVKNRNGEIPGHC